MLFVLAGSLMAAAFPALLANSAPKTVARTLEPQLQPLKAARVAERKVKEETKKVDRIVGRGSRKRITKAEQKAVDELLGGQDAVLTLAALGQLAPADRPQPTLLRGYNRSLLVTPGEQILMEKLYKKDEDRYALCLRQLILWDIDRAELLGE